MNSDCLNVYALFSGLISKHFTVRRRSFEELLTVQLHVNSVWHKRSMHSMLPCHCVRVFGTLTAHRTHNILYAIHYTIFILMLLNIPSIHPAIHPLMCFINRDTFFNSFNNFIQLYPPDWFESLHQFSSIHSFVHSEISINQWGYESRQVYIRRSFSRLEINLCNFIICLQIKYCFFLFYSNFLLLLLDGIYCCNHSIKTGWWFSRSFIALITSNWIYAHIALDRV